MRTFAITTLGCKVNQYESARFAQALRGLGLTPAPPGVRPDLCLIHTCAVTAQADRKSRRAVRAAVAGGAAAVVTGCWATAQPQQALRLSGVQRVFVNGCDEEVLGLLVDWVEASQRDTSRSGPLRRQSRRSRSTAVGTSSARHHVGAAQAAGLGHLEDDGWMSQPLPNAIRPGRGQRPATSSPVNIHPADPTVKTKIRPLDRFDGHSRAFVKVQDGCDARCSFCVVPDLRPHLSWRPVERVVEEVRSLVAAGHREVVLTGIFLGAYGRSTALRRRWVSPEPRAEARGRSTPPRVRGRNSDPSGNPLLALLDAVSRVRGLARVRLSSLEPGDVTDDLLALMASRDSIVPHLHLPLQSGSDAVLARMNRQYRRGDFEEMIQRVTAALDRPALTTDVIVGFPGETEADFEATLAMCRRAGFARMHAFRFSPRAGTPAARWTDRFVPAAVVRERMARLADLAADLSLAYRRQFLGQTVRVIVERPAREIPAAAGSSPATVRRGRSDRYFMVHFPVERQVDFDRFTGQLATVRIDRVTPTGTFGTLMSVED